MDNRVLRAKERKIKAIFFSALALALVGLIRLLFNMIVGRSFGEESVQILGMANVALSMALMISTLGATGFQNVINKFVTDSLSRNENARARWIYERTIRSAFLVILPVMAVIFLLHSQISDFLNIESDYLIIALPIILASTIYYLIRGTFYSLGASQAYFSREFIADVFFLGVLLLLVWLNYPTLILLSFSAMYLLFMLISIKEIDRRLPESSKDGLKLPSGMDAFAGISTIGSVMSLATIYVAIIYVGVNLGAKEAGLYAAAFSVSTLVLLIPNGISLILLPDMAHMWGTRRIKDIKENISFWIVALLLFCGIIIGPMMIMGKDVLILLFGERFESAASAMILILLGILMLTTARAAILALIGTKFLKVPATLGIFGFIFAFAIWIFFVPEFGILGAAFGYLISAMVSSIGCLLFSIRTWGINVKPLARPAISFSILIITIFFFIQPENFNDRLISMSLFLALFVIINLQKIVVSIKKISTL